jgi:surface antigen
MQLAKARKVGAMITKKIPGAMFVLAAVLITTSCATQEQTGRLLGGAAGAAVGTQVGDGDGRTIATIGGAVIGAVIGGAIGSRMDDKDRQQTGYALENSRTGQSTTWSNPDTGYRYDMRPTSTYESTNGPCRNYTMLAVIDGRNETINGTACRQADGTWR